MKTRKLITMSAMATVLLLGGCKKFLTEKPLAQVAIGDFYKNRYDMEASLTGVYSAFQQEMVGKEQYTEKYLYWGEYRSDNFDRFLAYTKDYVDEIALNGLTPTNQFSDWSGLYAVIGRANSTIKFMPQAAALDVTLTPALADSYLSQAYALRAVSYFYLVRVWGDAPIRLEPYVDIAEPADYPRESKDKVISQVIIPDLEKAYSLVVKGSKPVVYNMGEAAICATLADVYMWKKDYPNAIKWIKNLFAAKNPLGTVYAGLSDANLQPSASWKTLFAAPATSNESIWSIHWDYLKNGCACMQSSWTSNNKQISIDEGIWATWFQPQSQATRSSDIRPRQTADVFLAQPKPNRDRFLKWYPTAANPTATDIYPASYREMPVYLTMYRLGDIYLLYAEALNGSGDLAGALKYLNFIRKRAGIPEYLATDPLVASQTAMEDAILNERQLELFGEGKRWFDLVRTNHVKQVMDPILKRRQLAAGNLEAPGFQDPETKSYWPLNRNVLNSNRKLVQNPGYTD
ncbi:RagB/SusD family nutrient uptake outer membrane protein [Pedobacter caeni]|uniref:Starch-binding associating with outer membrane n=1 Tax=Pedobacter caeni TaxID=288992 RepID=A0A1M5ISW5_9SPHI|nr:RagB/SusD family nutrient uptake outer membrane protein [Pedobacter caeni]SHG31414.1 Starch-binding associating with outer membrane [Pedobacter caeni]